MLKLYKLKHYFNDNKKYFLLTLIFFIVGFICGSVYINFITELDFSKASSAFLLFKSEESQTFYSYSDEIIILGIFIGGFILFGKWVISFFIFRYGFMTGYFCVFLIKLFSLDGILPSGIFLFLNLIFIFPFVIILSQTGYTLSQSLENVFLKNYKLLNEPGKLLIFYTLIFLCSLVAVSILSRIKMNIFLNFVKNVL